MKANQNSNLSKINRVASVLALLLSLSFITFAITGEAYAKEVSLNVTDFESDGFVDYTSDFDSNDDNSNFYYQLVVQLDVTTNSLSDSVEVLDLANQNYLKPLSRASPKA